MLFSRPPSLSTSDARKRRQRQKILGSELGTPRLRAHPVVWSPPETPTTDTTEPPTKSTRQQRLTRQNLRRHSNSSASQKSRSMPDPNERLKQAIIFLSDEDVNSRRNFMKDLRLIEKNILTKYAREKTKCDSKLYHQVRSMVGVHKRRYSNACAKEAGNNGQTPLHGQSLEGPERAEVDEDSTSSHKELGAEADERVMLPVLNRTVQVIDLLYGILYFSGLLDLVPAWASGKKDVTPAAQSLSHLQDSPVQGEGASSIVLLNNPPVREKMRIIDEYEKRAIHAKRVSPVQRFPHAQEDNVPVLTVEEFNQLHSYMRRLESQTICLFGTCRRKGMCEGLAPERISMPEKDLTERDRQQLLRYQHMPRNVVRPGEWPQLVKNLEKAVGEYGYLVTSHNSALRKFIIGPQEELLEAGQELPADPLAELKKRHPTVSTDYIGPLGINGGHSSVRPLEHTALTKKTQETPGKDSEGHRFGTQPSRPAPTKSDKGKQPVRDEEPAGSSGGNGGDGNNGGGATGNGGSQDRDASNGDGASGAPGGNPDDDLEAGDSDNSAGMDGGPVKRPKYLIPRGREARVAPWGEIWHADFAPLFPFGETTYITNLMSRQIADDLAQDPDPIRRARTAKKQSPGWFSRLFGSEPPPLPPVPRESRFTLPEIAVDLSYDELVAADAFSTPLPRIIDPEDWRRFYELEAQNKAQEEAAGGIGRELTATDGAAEPHGDIGLLTPGSTAKEIQAGNANGTRVAAGKAAVAAAGSESGKKVAGKRKADGGVENAAPKKVKFTSPATPLTKATAEGRE